jgi:DNA invertase Pin-like site-specific DNA recombinase
MKEKILKLRKEGFTINEITKELGCAKSTVSYHINNNGLGGSGDKFLNGVDDETIEKIKRLRLEFKTYPEILEIVNITEDKLIKICRKLKLNKQINTFKNKMLNVNEVLSYYLKVKSLRKTAKHFGVSRDTIRKYIPDEKIIIKREKLVSNVKSVVDFRKRVKSKLVEYKGGCCEKCGYNKSEQALQFHHINPDEKDFTISGKSYSFERMKKEVDKCIMVCANCHIEIHEEERNNNI